MKRSGPSLMPSPVDFKIVRNIAAVPLLSIVVLSVGACGSRSLLAGSKADAAPSIDSMPTTGGPDGAIWVGGAVDAGPDSGPVFSISCSDAATPRVLATATICTRFTRDPLFDNIAASDSAGEGVVGVAGTGAPDLYVALQNDFEGKVARWDGFGWTMEKLPQDPFSISTIAIDTAGEPWAVVALRGNSKSGVGGPSGLVHRRNGAWILEPNPSPVVRSIWGTTSGLFLIGVDSPTGVGRTYWGWQDPVWRPMPLTQPAAKGTSGFWGAGCGQVLAFGAGGTADTSFAALFRPDMSSWALVSAPVPGLAAIEAVSGTSIDDLYVLAVSRNDNVTRSVIHVTNDLQTWTLLATPPVVDYQTILWSPRPSVAVALGCEWLDKTQAPARDCARLTTFFGDTVSTASVPGVEGAPVAVWGEPVTGTLHLFTAVPAANGIFHAQHYVAPAECP
jgi:hypothetical protein